MSNVITFDVSKQEEIKELTGKSKKSEKEYRNSGTRHGVHSGTRSRYFCLLLYPDNPVHMDVLEWVKQKEDYVAILHNADILSNDSDSDNTLDSVLEGSDDSETHDNQAKDHWHVLVRFPNVRTLKGVKKYFGNDIDNFVKICSDPYSFALYMLHDTYDCKKKSKHLYSYNDLEGVTSLKTRLFSNRRGVFVEHYLTQIIEIIDARQVISLRSLMKYLIRQQLFDLMEFVTSHAFLVKSLLIDKEQLDSGYGSDSFIPEHVSDDEPLISGFYENCDSDIIAPDFLFSQRTQEIVPSNRSQRRKRQKKSKK